MKATHPFAMHIESGDYVVSALSNHPNIVHGETVDEVSEYDGRIYVAFIDGYVETFDREEVVTVIKPGYWIEGKK